MSRIGNVETKLLEHLAAATTLDFAVEGPISDTGGKRCASLTWGGDGYNHDSTGLLDKGFIFNLRIRAATKELINLAFEELETWWQDATRRAELSALGVITIKPDEFDMPVAFNDTHGGVFGDQQFIVRLRRAS